MATPSIQFSTGGPRDGLDRCAKHGARIDVWREADLFHARRADHVTKPQTSLSVDLFEVIADLADLDLDDPTQAAEAMGLAAEAQRRLRSAEDQGDRS